MTSQTPSAPGVTDGTVPLRPWPLTRPGPGRTVTPTAAAPASESAVAAANRFSARAALSAAGPGRQGPHRDLAA